MSPYERQNAMARWTVIGLTFRWVPGLRGCGLRAVLPLSLAGELMGWIYTLFLKIRDRPDPALDTAFQEKGGHRVCFTGHDEGKATAAIERAKAHDERQRRSALARGGQLTPRRGLSKVERIDSRRQA